MIHGGTFFDTLLALTGIVIGAYATIELVRHVKYRLAKILWGIWLVPYAVAIAFGLYSAALFVRLPPVHLVSLVEIGHFLLALGLPLAIFFLRSPRSTPGRACLAVGVAWVAGIVYAAFVENPAGIAAGHAAREHFPEARFDNNTIASAIAGGWVIPVLVVGIAALARRLRSRNGDPQINSTPSA